MPRRGGGGARRVRRTRRRRRRRRILLVGGLVAFGTYKMTTKDADRVKEHTGTDPEELTDEELAQAMDQLGIDKQQVTGADKEIEATGDATTPAAATALPSSSTTTPVILAAPPATRRTWVVPAATSSPPRSGRSTRVSNASGTWMSR